MQDSSLVENFPSTYQDFFEAHELVFSAHGILNWIPEFHINMFSPHISSSIDKRMYIWIQFNNSNSYKFHKISYYSPKNWTFQDFNSNTYNKSLSSFIEYFVQKYEITIKGCNISILSEFPPGKGFGFSLISSTLIATFLTYLLNEIDCKSFKNYKKFLKSDGCRRIFNLSLKISSLLTQWVQNWWGSMTSILGSNQPILYLLKDNFSTQYESFDRLNNNFDKVYYKSVDHFFNTSSKEVPFDFGIINFWVQYSFEEKARFVENEKKKHEKLLYTSEILLNKNNINKERFTNLFDNLKVDFDKYTTTTLTLGTSKIIWALRKVYSYPFDTQETNEFLEKITQLSRLCSFIDNDSTLITDIQSSFQYCKSNPTENIGLSIANTGKSGWSIVFFCHYNKSRTTINDMIQDLQNKWYEHVNLLYKSRDDNNGFKWIELEQSVRDKVFSKYCNTQWVIYIDATTRLHTLWNYNDILANNKKWLVFDTISSKVFLYWDKLNSDQIHSQQTTVDILTSIVTRDGTLIKNNEIASSSYAKNKNEMVGKITAPLNKLIEQHFWLKNFLQCKWANHDFYIEMNTDHNLNIGVVVKMSEYKWV